MEYLNIESMVKPVQKPKGYVVIILAIFTLLSVAYEMGGGSGGRNMAIVLIMANLYYMLLPVLRLKKYRREAIGHYATYLQQLSDGEVRQLRRWPQLTNASRNMIEQRLEGSNGRSEAKSE
ncbi:hypothetical protein [Rheinheimera hassiensis]|uniref:hypothetical protein n=1 Tax=Rheinheimera hassiensis TaxID=1193627 RepID=UPI001F05739B|nr:hypothetical protein [Rheinheimera hassiensis]